MHPGGGGQPCDTGTLALPGGQALPVAAMRENDAGVLWHCTRAARPPHVPRTYLRTLDGRVRMAAIKDFNTQACGGTQVARTSERGRLRIVRTEVKGRQNKRLYVALDPP